MALRLTAALMLVALLPACATLPGVRLDTGQGAPREHRPAAASPPVKVEAAEFERALAHLVLELPLALRPPQPGWLVRTSSSSGGDAEVRWQRLMSKSYGGFCKAGQRREDCLSLLDDVAGLSEWGKLGVALSLSLEPLKASISQAVEQTLAPQLFYAVIATGLVSWAVLASNPEPVFTKAAAVVAAVLLVYLGVEVFLEVVRASRELKRATDKATTYEELQQASQRFASRVGPELARVFVLAVTVVVSHGMAGGSALLASRLSMLPRFPEAVAVGASQVGIRLESVGQVSAVAVIGGTVVISLPSTALAMVAQEQGGGATAGDNPAGFRSWGSFSGLKSALGPAGEGKQWHHIVEQTPGNVGRFGPHALHNTENVIPLDTGIHKDVSRLYSAIRPGITNSRTLTVRQWLSTQSYEAQRAFGLKAIENVRNGVWP
jgi:hypothetical protein